MPYEDLGFAKVDHHRSLRKGFPEVVFGMGKTPEQIARLATALLERTDRVLVTKVSPEVFPKVREAVPDAHYDRVAGTIVVDRRERREPLITAACTVDAKRYCLGIVCHDPRDIAR